MGTARRLYLYGVSAISLLVLAVGLHNLVAVVLGEVADALGANIIGAGATGREQVSLAIALVLVGGPVFGIHWWLVGRGWRGTDAAAEDDRHSTIRAFHLGLVSTVALVGAAYAAVLIIDGALRAVLGVAESDPGRASDDWAILLVAAPIWWFHWARRAADLRHDRLAGAAAWLTRLHRYGWAFAGLMLLVVGSSQVLETLASVLIGRSGFGTGDAWWLGPLSWSLALIAVGAGLFAIHMDDARRTIRDAAIIGTDDRTTAIRATYFGGVILVAVAFVGVTVASSIAELLRLLLGVADDTSLPGVLERGVGPLIVTVPYAVAGWLHWTAQRREAAGRGPAEQAAAERLALHLVAGVGLAFLAVGAGQLIGRLLEVTIGSGLADEFFRYEAAWFMSQVLVGAVLWIPAWAVIVRRRAADPAIERRATASRAYLYLVVGVSLLAAVPSAAFVLFKLIDTLLGGGGIDLGRELALPLAAVIVAGLVAGYHGRLLVADLRETAAVQPATPTGEAIPGSTAPLQSLYLTLRGPDGADLAAVADGLRSHLPPGVVLEGR